MSDNTPMSEKFAEIFWDMDGGGKDFHSAKYNHAVSEGYELTFWEPFYPQALMIQAYDDE